MKLDPKLITDDFKIKECTFGGDACIWIAPALMGVAWDNRNLILRSSIWRKSDYELVSPGLKKFFAVSKALVNFSDMLFLCS